MAGLPASGKTAIARELARQISAVHIRIDTIEQAVVRSGAAKQPLGPVGYVIGYAVAADCLRQGLRVVADSVNPLPVTREAWREVAREAGVRFTEIGRHTSELQSRPHLVCRLLLEKKKK